MRSPNTPKRAPGQAQRLAGRPRVCAGETKAQLWGSKQLSLLHWCGDAPGQAQAEETAANGTRLLKDGSIKLIIMTRRAGQKHSFSRGKQMEKREHDRLNISSLKQIVVIAVN